MAYEDFTAYTEVDPTSELTQTTTKSDWTGHFDRPVEGYLHYDHGASNFGTSFTHEFELYETKSANYQRNHGWCLANSLGTWDTIKTASGDALMMGWYTQTEANKVYFIVIGIEAGTSTENGATDIVLDDDTLYYCTVIRTSGNLKTRVYSDASRTTEVSGSPQDTTIANTAYQYLMAPCNYGASTYAPSSGYIQNLDIDAAAPAGGQPTMRRWGGVPGMNLGGRSSW